MEESEPKAHMLICATMQKIADSHVDAKCGRAYGRELEMDDIISNYQVQSLKPMIYELNDDIIFNDQVQPLSLGIKKYINLQTRSLFTVKYDTDMTHTPLTLIPLQTDLVWLNTSVEDIPLQIKTRRPFQYRNINNPDKEIACSPLIACDEVTETCDLLALWNLWEDAEMYFTIAPHFDWMKDVLRRVMKGDF
uniref:Uncharacterized protein n=1 Tax=Romanomermis culicivorax TaxID=13658 RepID=A0A915L0E6_ROMCU